MLKHTLFYARRTLVQRPVKIALTQCRCLTATAPLLKVKKNLTSHGKPRTPGSAAPEAVDDPAKIQMVASPILTKLARELSEIKLGRDDVEVVAKIRMPADKKFLSQYADVVQRDRRTYLVTVFDPEHVKEVSSAIAQSGLNFNPQPVPNNAQLLTIAIPAPSNSFKQEQVGKITKKGEAAKMAIRALRNDTMKRIQKSKASKDEIRDGEKSANVVFEGIGKELDELLETAKKAVN